jgi:MHS family metabolite:H+ symporter-like MFS transporter
VLGLFALENITMAEMFGSRNRLYPHGNFKRGGGLVAVGWPGAGRYFLQYDRFLDADCVMLVCYSIIGLISAILMPEVRDRDLSLLNDAADCAPKPKAWVTGNIFKTHQLRTE